MRGNYKWHSLVGVAAIGMFAFSVYGGPRITRVDDKPAVEPAVMSHELIGYEIIHSLGPLPEGAVGKVESVPLDFPIPHFRVLDDASKGRVAATSKDDCYPPADSAVVYSQPNDSGYFYPWAKGMDIGNMVANPMNLGNGFDYTAGHQLSGYDLTMYNSASGFGEAGVDVELWHGDPLGWIETGPDWGPIAGTQCSWTGLVKGGYDSLGCIGGYCDGGFLHGTACTDDSDCGLCPGLVTDGYIPPHWNCDDCIRRCAGFYKLVCEFDAPIAMTTNQPYMVAYMTAGCRMGWRASWYFAPTVAAGNGHVGCTGVATPCTDFVEEVYEYGQFNYNSVGTCCDTGAACDHSNLATDDDCVHPTFCSSGAVDTAGGWYYGAPTYYASFVATIYAPQGPVVEAVPRSNDAGCAQQANGFFCENGADGGHFTFDFNISNWNPAAPTPADPRIKTWQIKINSSAYVFDMDGYLTPYNPPCTGDPDCVAAIGGGTCNDPGYPPGGCSPGYMDWSQDPNCTGAGEALQGCLRLDLPAVSISTPDFVFGSTIVFNPPATDNHNKAYAGTVVLVANAVSTTTCKGKGLVKFNPAGTYLKDNSNNPIPLIGMVNGYVEVPVGQCCDLSVQPFVCIDDCYTKAECDDVGGVWTYGKTCDDDCGCTADTQCGDGDACTVNYCNVAQQCVTEVNTVPAGSCCDPTCAQNDSADLGGTGAIASNVDGDQCTDDICVPGSGCAVGAQCGVPSNPYSAGGTACDDENQCTYNDTCDGAGLCAGLDVNAVSCGTSTDCEIVTGVAFDCVGGYCLCVLEPPLTFVKVDPPAGNCYEEGDKIEVNVFLGAAANVINGAQMGIFYDPTCMDFESIVPAGDPYVFEMFEMVDEGAGWIFYAVGVDPLGGVGTNGNANLATLTFTKIGECNSCNLSFGGENPYDTFLTDDDGQYVGVVPEKSKDVYDEDELWIDVPDDVEVNVDCDMVTAEVYWDAPTGGSDCYGVDLACWGTYPDMSAVPDGVVMGGGEFPIGESTFCCTVTSQMCGDQIEDCWTVTVNEQTTLDVVLQLSPIIVADDLIRCIEFELFANCVEEPLIFDYEMHFGGMWDHIGHFTDTLKIPGVGQWYCITAMDQLHTLRSTAYLECVDGVYYAVFKGDPFFGGNWLIGGNLDAFKKENPNASHNVIDILDFGQFVANYLDVMDPNTYCPSHPEEGHADINGDGIVNALDFAFIQMNFLEHSKDACCPGSVADVPVAVTEVSVSDLRLMGLGDLAVGDLNRDGLLNTADMDAFLSGVAPKNPRGLRSGK